MPLKSSAFIGLVVLASASGAAFAQEAPPEQAQSTDERLRALEKELSGLKEKNAEQGVEIQQLRTERGEQWLTDQRAQQIREVVGDVLADSSTRANLQATGAPAGYDKNFFLVSTDGNFKLNIRGQLQARFAYNNVPGAATTPTGAGSQSENLYGFEIRRAKIYFNGHVFDPSWKYMLEIAFERNGGANSAPTAQSQVTLESAYIEKLIVPGVAVRVGEWLLQFNQEEMVGSGSQQFVERSLVNSYFSPKYIAGAQLILQQDAWRTFLSVTDGGGNRDTAIIQTKNLVEWATTARGEILLAGAWDQFLAYQGWVGSDFAAMLGFGVNWQRGTGVQGVRNTVGNGTIPGAPGGGEEASMVTYTGDVNFRGNGWSLSAAAYGNLLYAFTPTPMVPGDVQSYGVTVQGGVFLNKEIELIARYEGLWVTNGVTGAVAPNALNSQTLNVVTVGGNYYFNRNQIKFTLDAGYAFNAVMFNSGIYGDAIGGAEWRSTLNAATSGGGGSGEFVLRSQLQLLF